MTKIFFVLAIASVASAADTCPNISGYIARKTQTLAEVKATVQTVSGLQTQAKSGYERLLQAQADKYRVAEKKASEDLKSCGQDVDCAKQVAELLRTVRADVQAETGRLDAEEKDCQKAFYFVYQTQIAAGIADSLKKLISLYPENVRLASDINLLPIENPKNDSETFNLVFARKPDNGNYRFGNVGLWYDLQTPKGLVRVAGMIASTPVYYTTKETLAQSLQKLEKESIPSYGLDLDRVTSKFIKGKIKYQVNYYYGSFGYDGGSASLYYNDRGEFGNATAALALVTFENVL